MLDLDPVTLSTDVGTWIAVSITLVALVRINRLMGSSPGSNEREKQGLKLSARH